MVSPLVNSTLAEQFYQSIPQLIDLLDDIAQVRVWRMSLSQALMLQTDSSVPGRYELMFLLCVLLRSSFVVAAAPFKAIYANERKRHKNNKKVMLLFVEMRDTMAVVLQCVPRVHVRKASG
jgi:hypothetical protein